MHLRSKPFYFYGGVTSALGVFLLQSIRSANPQVNPFISSLLDSAPSGLGVVALLMLLHAVIRPANPTMFWLSSSLVVAGTLTHEVAQHWTRQTFDRGDLLAIAVGFVLFCVVHRGSEGESDDDATARTMTEVGGGG